MSTDYGSGVSRTLSALQRQFQLVVWQKGKPPLDAELNLMAQIEADRMGVLVSSMMHSGFIIDPTAAQQDFATSPLWSNFFKLGRAQDDETAPSLWANVNGWIIPVTGSAVSDDDPSNRVDLFPPPSSDARIDLVFLEAWVAQVAPNSSTANKPAADKVWKYGNVKFGGTNIEDDIEDPVIGSETSERVQVQYRIRVFGQGSGLGATVALDDFPDGLDDPNVVGQGAASAAVAGFTFLNMRETTGDSGLWRAGDGVVTNELGTVDGYTYAIPICAVFRRNSDVFVAQLSGGNGNQNGAVDRNPTTLSFTDPAEGTVVLGSVTLTNAISETDTGNIEVEDLAGSGLDNPDLDWTSTFLVIDNEVFSISAVDTSTSPGTIAVHAATGRGRWGTMAVPHSAGAAISFFNFRHDDLFADQVTGTDILDLRKSVTLGDWDYQRILAHNLSSLVRGDLRTSYKQAAEGDTQGPAVVEVDTLWADGTSTVPSQTESLDGPDGIRTIFSDAASIQPDVTMLLDDPSSAGSPGFVTSFEVSTGWDVAASFVPGGFVVTGDGWRNGDSIFVYLGGSDGTGGARGTFRDGGANAVRFLMPREFWLSDSADPADVGMQHPVSMRFLDNRGFEPAAPADTGSEHPGPMYPLKALNFEKPFITLGGILNSDSQVSAAATVHPETGPSAADWEVELTGLDFDAVDDWYSLDSGSQFENDPDALSKPVLQSTRTLYGMLTDNGRDRTGAASEVYIVLWGDTTNAINNGVFKVVGAGTVGYTTRDATATDRVRVELITQGMSDFISESGLTAEFRSQFAHSEDGGGFSSGTAAMCIVFTDIECDEGGTDNPWNTGNLASAITVPVASKMALRLGLQYHPGRGATARVADKLHRVSIVTAGSEYLHQSPATRDSTFPALAGTPDDETFFDLNHIQTWNRLSSRGLDAPEADSYGGAIVSFTEQDREAECFVDAGSKTMLFRPFLNREMTLQQFVVASGQLIPTTYTLGHDVDGAVIFAAGLSTGYAVPPEYMPRFGRQDIPFYLDVAGTGAGTFLQGINHLFTDGVTETSPQFNIVGGQDNSGSAAVNSIRFQTTDPGTSGLAYGEYGSIAPGGIESAFQSRLYEDTDVVSSDLGRVLKGIQLPPFYGIVRLYGIYDLRDYQTAGGATFESDRFTPEASAPPNLLRTDAEKQTLFIVQGGGSDATGDTDDHTYVIPQEALDITLSDSYTAGEAFEDLEYVVEAVVFGFARGFINKNNYVMARENNGAGDPAETELVAAEMTIPAAATINDQMYIAYNRTPYQGDPYMTREGSTRTTSDYEHRYGQIPPASAFELGSSIQQFDNNGDLVIETPNLRPLQVLAAVDFWTTLGTGKVGGELFPGTVLDIGHTVNTTLAAGRVPAASSDPVFQVGPRTFTEGQGTNPNHAKLSVIVSDNSALVGGDGIVIRPATGGGIGILAGAEYVIGGDAAATATAIAAAINADTSNVVTATVDPPGNSVIVITAVGSGAEGGDIEVSINNADAFTIPLDESSLAQGVVTAAFLRGGVDLVVNSGDGASSQALTGLTERLPLGILLQDSDFLGEDLLRDGSGQLSSSIQVLQATSTATPLTDGQEYTRLVGGTGGFIAQSDGGILKYTAYDAVSAPTGTKKFRLFRGGGAAYVLSSPNPGGPVDWVAGSLPPSFDTVLKGGVLVGKALLVRNYPEEAFTGNSRTSHGDEIQMVILTHGILGDGNEGEDGVSLKGLISPTGYGEGYAAADRYRLEGKPMVAGHARRAPDTDEVELATFPFDDLTSNVG